MIEIHLTDNVETQTLTYKSTPEIAKGVEQVISTILSSSTNIKSLSANVIYKQSGANQYTFIAPKNSSLSELRAYFTNNKILKRYNISNKLKI